MGNSLWMTSQVVDRQQDREGGEAQGVSGHQPKDALKGYLCCFSFRFTAVKRHHLHFLKLSHGWVDRQVSTGLLIVILNPLTMRRISHMYLSSFFSFLFFYYRVSGCQVWRKSYLIVTKYNYSDRMKLFWFNWPKQHFSSLTWIDKVEKSSCFSL